MTEEGCDEWADLVIDKSEKICNLKLALGNIAKLCERARETEDDLCKKAQWQQIIRMAMDGLEL